MGGKYLNFLITEVNGWKDGARPAPLNETAIQSPTSRLVSQGGSTILECHLRTNSPSPEATVTWKRNNVTISMLDSSHRQLDPWTLLVRNFSLSSIGEDKTVMYECRVDGGLLGEEIVRSFDVTLAEGENYTVLTLVLLLWLDCIVIGSLVPRLFFINV